MPDQNTVKQHARDMRRHPTDAEYRLWYGLRGLQRGCKFRRQHALGNYIVDFICLSHRLVIEVDGNQHADNVYDEQRDQWLVSRGFVVLRFTNREILRSMDDVLGSIDRAIAAAAPTAPPP